VVNGRFLAHLVRLDQDQIISLVSGTTVYHLYPKDMAQFSFALPPMEEQKAIVEAIDAAVIEIDALRECLDKLRSIRARSHVSGTLISHCFEKHLPLRFWGRLDDQVAVDVGTLNMFLQRSSPDYVCKLVPKHHAKVIWWRGFGVYIGSANLTYSAWNQNVEAGCFFEEEELTTEHVEDIERMFDKLDEKASPLTEELRDLMIARGKRLAASRSKDPDFWSHPSVTKWGGLITLSPKRSSDKRREEFLLEWNETLEYLRDIAARVSQPEYRPTWIAKGASPGAQADQFLHAHYYNNTFDGHAQPAPADEPIVDRLVRPILARCIAPTKAIADHKDDPADDPSIIDPRHSMR